MKNVLDEKVVGKFARGRHCMKTTSIEGLKEACMKAHRDTAYRILETHYSIHMSKRK